MSLARAFTTRRVRQTLELKDNKDASTSNGNGSNTMSDGLLYRKQSTKAFTTHGSIRNKISAPVELTHTTNMLSYSAPDIFPRVNTVTVQSSPSTSSKSDDESDSGYTAASTPPTSPDTPFPDDKRAMSPEPNHLSCYFMPPRQMTPEVSGLGIASADVTSSPNASSPSPAQAGTAAVPASEAPAIPQRAPSHTKKSYDGLMRNRSVSRMSEQSVRSLSTKASFSFSRSSSSSTSTSVTSTSHTSTVKPSSVHHHQHAPSTSVGAIPSTIASVMNSAAPPVVSHKKDYSETHPFGHELAKVSELVEEFGKEEVLIEEPTPPISSNPIFAEEERELIRQGLKKFSAESYISDIQGLMSTFFAESRPMQAAVWI